MDTYIIKDLTFLSKDEILGENKLEVLKKYGLNAAVTDLAILTGAMYDAEGKNHVLHNKSLSGRTGCYATKTPYDHGDVVSINSSGEMSWVNHYSRYSSIRPVLKLHDFKSILCNTFEFYNGIYVVPFGEYPQYAASSHMQKVLEEKYNDNELEKTNKKYTFDYNINSLIPCTFNPVEYDEYYYNYKKYIRVKANYSYDSINYPLSNGEKYNNFSYVWVEVSPVLWLVDEKKEVLVSLRSLLSGTQFDSHEYNGDFFKTEIKGYLDGYMKHDLFKRVRLNSDELDMKMKESRVVKRINPYGFDFSIMSEEDIIKASIESDVPVFLHGPSSEGKSARVKQIDPTCEVIYLRNATPEYLNGKSVYNSQSGEMIDIPPTWLKKVEEKCQKEPDKLHVVFFDEITNALPSIQGMAFNIILDREVNGIWKLPKNARIVAAGNEMSDSLAANKLAEPLFNRFAHVYIKTTTDKWLKWASENNIHPAIYSYIAYTRGEALRGKYDGERPNPDPRKWEMASKMLYKYNNPEALRSLVGVDITREFIEFCNQQVITLDDVINDNYSSKDIEELNTAERNVTVVHLSQVDEENVIKVRDFVKELGNEYVPTFDMLWARGDDKRFEILQEIKLCERQRVKVKSNS